MPLKYILPLTISLLSLLILPSCVDDPLLDDRPVGPGQADVAMTVSFFPNVANDLGGSRAAGNAIEAIKTLQVAAFNEDGSLARLFNENELYGLDKNLSHTDTPSMSPEDAANGGSWTEGAQAKASFYLSGLPYGKYRFYAIANHRVSETALFSDDDMTAEERLRAITVDWNTSAASANPQMFGYFTAASDKTTDRPVAGHQAPTLRIDRANASLHAWIKRLASKVTVAFDGSGLHKNVNIYIHKVTVKDIPRSCHLGEDNSPSSSLADRSDVLHLDGETIFFNNSGPADANPGDGEANRTKWLAINNGTPVLGSDHSATAPALFFYENMQGDYPGDERFNKEPKAGWVHEYLNRPDADWHKRPWDYDTKDKIATGTYIEVEGFYESTNDLNTTSGPIKYRFMLGKNTTYNYNAQRNHHYKLTLRFKGWANQPEWHIEYVEEKPALYVPEPYYMPYLYNQRVDMPIRYIGDIQKLRVEIVENDWGPYDKAAGSFPAAGAVPAAGVSTNDFLWNRPAWNTYNGLIPAGQETADRSAHPYLGFLALRLVKNSPTNLVPDKTYNSHISGSVNQALTDLRNCYYNTTSMVCTDGVTRTRGPQNYREFTKEQLQARAWEPDVEYDNLEENYLVNEEAGARTLMLPLFTRAKTMILNSGYSGNNPYEYHHRKAKLKVTATFADGTVLTEYASILQVPRITNPKAVWRDATGTPSEFEVTLMGRSGPRRDADYIVMANEGSWSAEIESGNTTGNFSLKGDNTTTMVNGVLYGRTKSAVRFKVGFKGKKDCAVVLVKYNGEKCAHRVFLRQGYDPMQVDPGGATWAAYNLHHGGRDSFKDNANGGIYETSTATGGSFVGSPLRFGSMFKRRNLVHGILEENNDKWGHMVSINTSGARRSLSLSSGTSRTWRNIMGYWLTDSKTNGQNTGETTDQLQWTPIKVNGDSKTYYLPTYDQFNSLTTHAEFGFGILYGDGASTTQTSFAAATGYDGKNASYGMRGVVVYNKQNAHQIFFPISKSGQGRRNVAWQFSEANMGRLLYGDVDYVLTQDRHATNIYRPIPYNLPNNAGALYWLRKINPTGHIEAGAKTACAAWDMNYFNFDFGPYTANCLFRVKTMSTEDTGSDALPIRLVTTP